MPQVINTNIASLNAQRNLNSSQSALRTSLQRLSSGLRINSAKDDAAGLAISQRMTAQINGLNQAARNANDGISLAQTAEGALNETGNLLQRMRELAVQSANSTNSASDREALQAEVNQLQAEISRIADTTTFNGLKILNGNFAEQQFQVGANANEVISVSIAGAGANDLGSFDLSDVNQTANQGTGSAAAAAAALPANNPIAAQTLTVSTGDGTSEAITIGAGDSAAQVAAAVNATSGATGVTADATNEVEFNTLSADGTVSFTLSSSAAGSANISAAVTTTDLSALAESINSQSGKTGITAEVGGDLSTLTLKDSEGNDINIESFDHSGASGETINVQGLDGQDEALTQGGNNSTVVAGNVSFNSSEAFSVQSSVADSAGSVINVAAATDVSATETNINDVDISSVSGANGAIALVDAALQQVSAIRADLGAVQNRFSSTISNLQTTVENVSAARSRIQDADFAAETAALTRAQILQQAGTSVLQQANAQPQNVLSLLQ